LTAGNVVTPQIIQVRCCIDTIFTPFTCDPGEVQDSVFVDINPSGVPPPIDLVADPSVIPPLGTSTITASTTPPVPAGTNICFEIAINSTVPSTLFDGVAPPFCFGATSLGQAVVGLQGGDVMTQEAVTVLGCIDSGADNACDGTDPSNFVTLTITPPSPAIGLRFAELIIMGIAGDGGVIVRVTKLLESVPSQALSAPESMHPKTVTASCVITSPP